ncbi:MAG: 2-oxoglutarate dehydrogenase E1 subunit family protein, partial [Sphingomonadales bacterium]
MKDFSYITQSHPAFIENLYRDFVKDPASVDPDLRKFFEGFDFAFRHGAITTPATTASASSLGAAADIDWQKEFSVHQLIMAYRHKGHLVAKTNPIRTRKDRGARLELSHFGLSEQDLSRNFVAGQAIGMANSTLAQI